MAIVKIKPTKLNDFNLPAETPASTLVGGDGMDIDFSGKDFDILISVDTADVIVKAGNGLQGVSDLTVKAGNSVVLDSGCFKNISGAHKGCIYLVGAAAKVSAIELP